LTRRVLGVSQKLGRADVFNNGRFLNLSDDTTFGRRRRRERAFRDLGSDRAFCRVLKRGRDLYDFGAVDWGRVSGVPNGLVAV